MDNRESQYDSAANALNLGAKKAKGDILVFIHQDMQLESSETLKMIAQYFDRFGDNIVIGPAGKSKNYPDSTITNMKHGTINSRFAGLYSSYDKHKSRPINHFIPRTQFSGAGFQS